MSEEPVPQPVPRQSPLLRWLQLLLAVVPLLWVAHSVDLSGALTRLGHSDLSLWLLAVALSGVAQLAASLRWRVLFRAYGIDPVPSFKTLLAHYLAGIYFNLLPGGVGGDVARAYRTRDLTGGMVNSLLVVFVDRLCGLVGLLGLVALGAATGARSPDPRVALLGQLTLGLAVFLTLAVLSAPWLPEWFPRAAAWLRRGPRPIASLLQLRRPKHPCLLLLGSLISLVTQGAILVSLLVLLRAVDPSADVQRALPVAPWVILLIFAPITPMGLGQRELVFVELWSLVGISREAALGASVLALTVTLVYSLLGGLVLVGERLARERRIA